MEHIISNSNHAMHPMREDRTTFDGGRGLDRQLGRGEEEGGSRGEQEAQAYSLHSFGKGSGYRMWNNIL